MTTPLSEPPTFTAKTLGPVACKWIETHCVLGEGDYFGQPFKLRPWQRRFLYRLYELNEDGTRRYRRALLEVPKGNGKTPLAAAIAMFDLCGPYANSPIIPVGAASFEQADLVFGDMKVCARESPTLRRYLEVFDTEILVKGGPGRAYRVAAAAGTNDGQRPTTFVADELHEWTGNKERVHLVLANGTAKRRGGVNVNITTPGADIDSLCGALHNYGLQVNAGTIDDDGTLFVWYGAAEGAYDLDNPDELRQAIRDANPAADDFLNVAAVAARYHEVPRWEFERYHLGRWTRVTESWLPPGAWEQCQGTVNLEPDRPTFVGIDFALKHDCIAVVVVQRGEDDKVHAKARVWQPDGDTIDVAAVENHLRDLHRRYNVQTFAYDPAYFERSAQALWDEGLPMVEHPQRRERMVPACQNLYRLIVDGEIVHDGDPTFTDHVLSAVQRETDTGWTLSKGKSKRKIDAVISLAIATSYLLEPPEPPAPLPRVIDLSAALLAEDA